MKKKILLIVLVMMLPSLAYAQGQGPRALAGERQYRGRGPMAELSENQRAAFTELRQKHWEETKELREDMRAERAALNALLLSDEVSAEEIREQAEKVADLRNKMSEAFIEFRIQAKEELDINLPLPGYGPGHGRRGGKGRRGQGDYQVPEIE